MKKLLLLLFALMCLTQWIIPGKMVYDSERTLTEGVVYKFKTAPVDPSDPFRGKYITLNFQENFTIFEDSAEWQTGDEIFVTYIPDSAGFAKVENIYHTAPEAESYLKTKVDYVTHYQREHKLWYRLPFDQYYLEESKASQAEQLYWNAQRDSTQVTYALVSMGAGQAVLKDVIINNKSIVKIVQDLNEGPE